MEAWAGEWPAARRVTRGGRFAGWRQAGCALLPDFGFSNALKFTIAE